MKNLERQQRRDQDEDQPEASASTPSVKGFGGVEFGGVGARVLHVCVRIVGVHAYVSERVGEIKTKKEREGGYEGICIQMVAITSINTSIFIRANLDFQGFRDAGLLFFPSDTRSLSFYGFISVAGFVWLLSFTMFAYFYDFTL